MDVVIEDYKNTDLCKRHGWYMHAAAALPSYQNALTSKWERQRMVCRRNAGSNHPM